MRRLETYDWWPELVAKKDELSLRELAERFGVTPGAISAAFKRTGTQRRPAPPGPRALRKRRSGGKLPPEAGDAVKAGEAPRGGPPKPRPGSKDVHIVRFFDLLGEVPDAEVARKAGVSVRTIASYRARHDIAAFSGRASPLAVPDTASPESTPTASCSARSPTGSSPRKPVSASMPYGTTA